MSLLKVGNTITRFLLLCSVFGITDARQRVRTHKRGDPPPFELAKAKGDPPPFGVSGSSKQPLPAGRSGSNNLVPVRDLELFEVDQVDIEKVTAEDEAAEAEAAEEGNLIPFRFAIANEVSVTPETHGLWEESDDGTKNVWRFRTRSRDAASLNLGFDHFVMPRGGSLHLYDPYSSETIRAYTDLDNFDHRELWTAILTSEEAILEVNIPIDVDKADLKLHLSRINVGYRGPAPDVTILPIRPNDDPPIVDGRPATGTGRPIGGRRKKQRSLSGSCNVDVKCPEGDDWRKEIASVAVYSKGGDRSCTGFMVNNVEEDGTPYFQTANHCGINAGNAPSVVVYWNYETPTCGGLADDDNDDSASHNIHNANSQSGATFCASWEASDMTLIKLSSSPDLTWGVTYAGWDATDIESYTGAVAIHHPSVDEKRISFDYNATSTSSYWGTGTDTGDKSHIRVNDWDVGTTEGGSSGSPLFDPLTNRVIGQLHGGSARCGVDEPDYYGRFFVSWTGGGTDDTRLCNWLDPKATGALFVETYDPHVSMPRIICTPSIGSIPEGGSVTSTCTISSQYDFAGVVDLSATTLPQGVNAVFSPTAVTVPSGGEVTSTLTIAVTTTVAALTSSPTYDFDAQASYGTAGETHKSRMSVTVTDVRDDSAMYDSSLGAPLCWAVGAICGSGELLKGRGTISNGGAEEHAPNTLDACTDGGSGFYGSDESLESISVSTVASGDMVEGTEVEIEAIVQPYWTGQDDYADFYYTADATKPEWNYIGTVQPVDCRKEENDCIVGNVQSLKLTYILPEGSLQAVRVVYRYMGDLTACPTGDYDEADDLAFTVTPWTTIFFNDFEDGWQNFTTGGDETFQEDAERVSHSNYVHSGSYTLRIRDGTDADRASIYTYNITTSDYDFIRVSFWFNPRGINANEGFVLEPERGIGVCRYTTTVVVKIPTAMHPPRPK